MRIMLTILSGFAGLILVQNADILIRLDDLIRGGVRLDAASAWVGFCGAWALATALVYPAPREAGWLFGATGAGGLYVGVSTEVRVLVIWAAFASGLALLTTLACWEKRAADRFALHREQRDVAVHLALRSLQETVPELLARVPNAADVASPVRLGTPVAQTSRECTTPTHDIALRRVQHEPQP
jgi:hypothetical protein